MSTMPKLTCARKHIIDHEGPPAACPGVLVVLGVVFIFLMAPEILTIAMGPVISSATGYSDEHSYLIARLMVVAFAVYLCHCLILRFSCFRVSSGDASISYFKVIVISLAAALLLFLLLKYYQANLNHHDALILQTNVSKFKIDLRSMPALVLLASLISGNVLIPVFEEMLFRGVLLNYFSHKFNWAAGVSISSILFTAIHRSHLPIVLLFGVVASILALKFSRLFAPIVMHVVYNSTVTIDAMR